MVWCDDHVIKVFRICLVILTKTTIADGQSKVNYLINNLLQSFQHQVLQT
jgi:hypothetical protein